MATISNIEAKLEAGVQQFSAQEVATLLNSIRILQKGMQMMDEQLKIKRGLVK